MIPKYDLDEVLNLGLAPEVSNLIISRQNAKLRQETDEEKHVQLHHLWAEEWQKLCPILPLSGSLLHQRLYLLENRPQIKQKLKQAVLRSSNSNLPCKADLPQDEVLSVKPRHFVFPEAEKEGLNIFCYVDVPLSKGQKERWYVELERDIYNKDTLKIPMLEDGRGPADEEEEVIKFPAKAYKNFQPNISGQIEIIEAESGNEYIFLSYFDAIFYLTFPLFF